MSFQRELPTAIPSKIYNGVKHRRLITEENLKFTITKGKSKIHNPNSYHYNSLLHSQYEYSRYPIHRVAVKSLTQTRVSKLHHEKLAAN